MNGSRRAASDKKASWESAPVPLSYVPARPGRPRPHLRWIFWALLLAAAYLLYRRYHV
jgi:hypothetical protein